MIRRSALDSQRQECLEPALRRKEFVKRFDWDKVVKPEFEILSEVAS
ncbi:hypothetical protein HKBW3S25_00490 [Candidatus Hakubella thermalkaliphila]|uniref:Uncharacterized protein n=1 Tax=Candidatus Hakubella thermalkaliphila TaxID=2754717 RepID=A0A6V8QE74_9ACTN|nr:hypothetical protein HKBW3S25_00490 [Candidatus Hakubella thermalkaliphila]GFP43062.1 hypothetical protein HKBW3C_02194 [Candidatus Hakubella thermalkaliphila]